MDVTISKSKLSGAVEAIVSKSVAHRALICNFLANGGILPNCGGISKDIDATIECLTAIAQKRPILRPNESGTTFRLLLPIVAALGRNVEFRLEGRLPARPLSPLYEELCKHGCTLSPQSAAGVENPFKVKGKLLPGHYILDAGVSSQFISGLLFALPLLKDTSTLRMWGTLESASYVNLTLDALAQFGIKVIYDSDRATFIIPGNQKYTAPESGVVLEGDWSNAAFWLASGVEVTGLDSESRQGDRAIVSVLANFHEVAKQAGFPCRAEGSEALAEACPEIIDAADFPDLVPIIAVVATRYNRTTTIINAARLRLKESDRLAAVAEVLNALGADITETDDGLEIRGGKPLKGGATVSSHNDHRIAMAAAIAATQFVGEGEQPITITGAQAVEKSYPHFWEDLQKLGGIIEKR
ncbi:MAG: 3-phosphoshikimate 1-carboxyvinyltransferase [Oscillospiraceae bacterium]|nr:3-phosphoshikimate 1-carboxyvinyltransferase [Oscillospiraceae bacterium]